MTTRIITFLPAALFLISCLNQPPSESENGNAPKRIDTMLQYKSDQAEHNDTLSDKTTQPVNERITALEQSMLDAGLIDVADLDTNILIDLKYASADNFLGEKLYHGLTRCYLHPVAAEKLVTAQALLHKKKPGYRLLIFDGARPQSVQQRMWDLVKGTELERYVAEPVPGSLHNYGAAVDLTIVDEGGIKLDMGTAYDHFGQEAQPRYHKQMLQAGHITATQIENRTLLKTVMREAGFFPILTEWWHFNAFSRSVARKKLQLIP